MTPPKIVCWLRYSVDTETGEILTFVVFRMRNVCGFGERDMSEQETESS